MSRAAKNNHLAAISGTAAGVAHDVNNLMAAVTAAAEAALARQPADPETYADLVQIRISARRAAALLRRLLSSGDLKRDDSQQCGPRGSDPSRSDPRCPELRPREIDPLIEAFAATLRHVAGPCVRLDMTLGLPSQLVRLEEDDLLHALLNLAVNARDAMPDGGVLSLRTGLANIAEALVAIPETIPPGRYATIELRDSGCGVPVELLEQVFVPRFTTKEPDRGSGLGLNSVRETARRHGGFVSLDSGRDQGTAVRLFLPMPAMPLQDGAGRLVLLAEDEPLARRLVTRSLTDRGWRVVAAETAQAILRRLTDATGNERRPAVLVSDIALPGLDGPALVRAARRVSPGLPAVLVSGYSKAILPPDLDRVAFLRKPFAIAELLAAIAEMAEVVAPTIGKSGAFVHCSNSTGPSRT